MQTKKNRKKDKMMLNSAHKQKLKLNLICAKKTILHSQCEVGEGMVAHPFNPSTPEAEVGRSLS